MIVSENKSMQEILGFLKKAQKVVIVGCNECAATCKSGGEEEVLKMKEALESEGKTVLGYTLLEPACNLLKSKKDLKVLKEELKEADAVLSMACGDGTQTIVKNIKKLPVYPANNTMFIGETKRVGEFEESCKACGECELGWTGGICPVTVCAKGLINGACGGAKNGKCEVSPENDCAWIMIYEKLKELDQLENMVEMRPMKDYSKQNNPRHLNLKKKEEEASAEA
ncbi:methylenetetrahydrofolate reductase C-terminal domain-containing protein [Romboutsia sp. 1001216sp1]|nr:MULTISPECIES: methylenetetrahydrofolate reductase C-terminal domain-containing protein [Romboutsia]MCH1961265.1 methylenetetrahydrofolate reductase C-terminal domain-containing protein [Romboutsia hominis]MDB8789553.1 methylenetetrahydrofolate reductase C-terminal domain-containing protein [Romboutsia sp. 1001216sp1]MDB8793841.1 methylenetetrahydrofolate reductase C-terminal domain-containing protein [Romboutsia sp. 1001216sp1]MDB8796700.1 methylenetetrahydrofolate reductase C-terminal domai